uniref:Lipid scramblase CLPTM1L n=1 Tax=Cebus imitator TaxID=2715852 RepID=A0A2K5PUF5_CEBIM
VVPKPEEINLLPGDSDTQQQMEAEKKPTGPLSHGRPRLALNATADNFVFRWRSLPAAVHRHMKMVQLEKAVHHLPMLLIRQVGNRGKGLRVINQLPLPVSYDKVSLGRLRFWIHMQVAVNSLRQFGFSEKDADEVKGIFVDTNLYFLALTFSVGAFHLRFDFLAFKNDISFWKKSMIGMSTRQAWKVKKALKMTVPRRGLRLELQFGTYRESKRKTKKYHTQAMKNLSYLLYPLCMEGAVYSFLNIKYKSYFVSGVYAFGFLFMLLQLFLNYKLKSVAHLPWKAFTYKAFNTFIDYVFWWLYPVDKRRVNESGES